MPRFTEAELIGFAGASGDLNPLHLEAGYAHRTPFGERVVYGALSTLRALGYLAQASPGRRATRVSARFHAPLHLDRDYDVETGPSVVSFLEHGKRLSTVSVTWADDTPSVPAPSTTTSGRPMLSAAIAPSSEELVVRAGAAPEVLRYVSDPDALRRLSGDPLEGWSGTALSVLACASYLAGMETPGTQALLLEIDAVLHGEASGPLDVAFGLSRYDERFGLLTLTAEVTQDGLAVATLRVRALRRPDPVQTDVADALAALPANHDVLASRRALVVGGSRGLGAQLVAQLAGSGAEVVFTYASSTEAADRLVADLGPTEHPVRALRGDARDPQFWADLATEETDGFDLVICCSWPVFAKLGTAVSAVPAATDHLTAGLAMVAGPVLAFLPRMKGRDADVVVLSSELVNAPDSAYWQYVTGKAAVEGLVRALAPTAADVGFHVVRPSMLATDYAQSAVGDAPMPPGEAARIILENCVAAGPGVHELDIPLGGLP